MDQLYVRNAKLMRMNLSSGSSTEYEKQSHMGLVKPMTSKERQRRLRFKAKAHKMMHDLVMLELSCVLPMDIDVQKEIKTLRDLAILNMVIPDDGSSDIAKLFPKIE